jgi:hypothetical protein
MLDRVINKISDDLL